MLGSGHGIWIDESGEGQRVSMRLSLDKFQQDPEMGQLVVASKFWAATRRSRSDVSLDLPSVASDEIARVDRVFNAHGSDKASPHSYGPVYAAILSALPPDPIIVEVGIGTNHVDVPCNMGEAGIPGASLRAFREIRSDATVIGADVDERVLFEEPGIRTLWVDQLDLSALDAFGQMVGGVGSVDLLVDDGLHTKRSNLNTLRALFDAVRPGGYYVIEDIDDAACQFWRYMLGKLSLKGAVLHFGSRDRSVAGIDNLVVISC